MPNCFITGINGLVGSYFAREYRKLGYSILGMKRSSSDLSMIKDISEEIEWFEGDLDSSEVLGQAISKADLVIHAAAMVSFLPNDRKKLYHSNVVGTRNLVNQCLLCKEGLEVLYVSSVAAIGKPEGKILLDESDNWEEGGKSAYYTVSKYLAELEVWRGIEEGLKAVIVNPSIILGRGDYLRSSLKMIRFLEKGTKFYPTGTANVVDIRDLIAISTELLRRKKFGERYIISGTSVPYKQLFTDFSRALGTNPPVYPITKLMAGTLWRLDKAASILPFKQHKITKELLVSPMKIQEYDGNRAVQSTEISYTPLAETIRWITEDILKR